MFYFIFIFTVYICTHKHICIYCCFLPLQSLLLHRSHCIRTLYFIKIEGFECRIITHASNTVWNLGCYSALLKYFPFCFLKKNKWSMYCSHVRRMSQYLETMVSALWVFCSSFYFVSKTLSYGFSYLKKLDVGDTCIYTNRLNKLNMRLYRSLCYLFTFISTQVQHYTWLSTPHFLTPESLLMIWHKSVSEF